MNGIKVMLLIDNGLILGGLLTGNLVLVAIGITGLLGIVVGFIMHERQQKK